MTNKTKSDHDEHKGCCCCGDAEEHQHGHACGEVCGASCGDEADGLPDAVLAEVARVLKPVLPEGMQQAELAVAVAPGGKVTLEGFCTVNGEVKDLDLEPARAALTDIFHDYPERLMADGYGPSNVYTVFFEEGQDPAIEHSHDIAYGGRMTVQDISEELEEGLTGFLPEKWDTAWIRLAIDENGEGEYSGGYSLDGKEHDISEELYMYLDRLDALLNELRVAPEVPKDGWNMAEFSLDGEGRGELALLDVEYEDDEDDETEEDNERLPRQ